MPIPPADKPAARLLAQAAEMLRERLKNDTSAEVRFFAACRLTEFGDKSGLAELEKAALALQATGGLKSGITLEAMKREGSFDLLVPALERATGQKFGPVPMNPMLSSTANADLDVRRQALLGKVVAWIKAHPEGAATVAATRAAAGMTQEEVVAEIEKLGGKVERDGSAPEGPVMKVLFDAPARGVTDAVLEHFKVLNQVQVLNLIGAEVTDAGLEHLKGMKRLRTLVLSNTGATDAGLEHLKGLNQLQLLFLANTKLTNDGLKQLQGLNQLKRLALRGTDVADAGLEHLKGLNQLQTLDLGETAVTGAGLEYLKGLNQLHTLYLDNTQVTDVGLAHLEGLDGLQTLVLSNTKVTGVGLEHLKGLKQLQVLDLGVTEVTDAGLAHVEGLKQLQHLYLGNTPVTGAGLVEHLKGLGGLQSLDIIGTNVTPEGLEKLQEALPKCQIMVDSAGTQPAATPATGGAMTVEQVVAEIKSLGYSRVTWDNGGPQPAVVELVFGSRSSLTDAGLERLKGALDRLRYLGLGGSKVTDAGLAELEGLQELRELDLTGTSVTDAGLAHLQGLRNLRA